LDTGGSHLKGANIEAYIKRGVHTRAHVFFSLSLSFAEEEGELLAAEREERS